MRSWQQGYNPNLRGVRRGVDASTLPGVTMVLRTWTEKDKLSKHWTHEVPQYSPVILPPTHTYSLLPDTPLTAKTQS